MYSGTTLVIDWAIHWIETRERGSGQLGGKGRNHPAFVQRRLGAWTISWPNLVTKDDVSS